MQIKSLSIFLWSYLLLTIILSSQIFAQTESLSANSWISYGKPYLKISVNQKGVQKLPFSLIPSEFNTSQPAKIQLWHRGKQVSILSTDNSEILFYGVPNDGSSDSLFYRPMSSRMNPYSSMYSDESSYFLVIGDSLGLRAPIVNQNVDSNLPLAPNNLFKLSTQFRSDYSLSTQNPIRPVFFNSFFELGAGKTGEITLGGKLLIYPLNLSNRDISSTLSTTVEFLVHGRSNNARSIEIYVGKDEQSIRLVQTINSSGFEASKSSFTLKADDLDNLNKGVIAFKSISTDRLNRFSLAYYDINYPQFFTMNSELSHEFNLTPVSVPWSKIKIEGAPANAKVIDITNVDQPRIILGPLGNIMVSRTSDKFLKLLVSSEAVTLTSNKVNKVAFVPYDPKSANYLIVTSENLIQGSDSYAEYRSSKAGGSFKTLVAKIQDLYNQFNYGEPSPVAIRRFVEFMLSDKNKDKYLLLIGKSTTSNERMTRELPGEIPTVGLPGSDVLLVEGLAGELRDVSAIPVGRLSALSNQSITDYLQKVKEYEYADFADLGWRKEVLHLNGGKTAAEINQLKNLLADLVPDVTNGILGGEVTPFVKQQGIAEVETVNITPEVNRGVGLITYFGHGSTTVTDLDMGYITDVNRGYNNTGKYPMMYFNGCGVGNIFSGNFNPNPGASDRYALSLDWMLTPKKGAIAIIANSFESFVGPSEKYLDQLYKYMFSDPTTSNLSIGKIQSAIARKIVIEDPSVYNIANIHQSLLQGDPALKLVTVLHSDYAVNSDGGISIRSESSSKTIEASGNLKVEIVVSNLGRFLKEEKVPLNVTFYYKDDNEVSKQTISAVAYKDTLVLSIPNKRILQRIEVEIDPEVVLTELSTKNNTAELLIDWDIAKGQYLYPIGNNKDVIAPLLNVKFNNRSIKNDEKLASNPIVVITLEDDRFLNIDTSLVNVFIKPCGDDNCDYKKLSYSSGEKLEIIEVNSRSIKITYVPKSWNTGVYELLVTGKDQAGNSSINPYTIRFSIQDNGEDSNIKVTVSPNPVSTYVRFETEVKDTQSISSLHYYIYDLSGRIIFNTEVIPSQSKINEYYWFPKSVSSGLYVYKVVVNKKDSSEERVTGKVVILN